MVPSRTGGSSTSTAWACAETSSTSGRPLGLPISSSAVSSTVSGRDGGPERRIASSITTIPPFMSSAPGPWAASPETGNGIR
jgi:hypothetical protein